jgi:uncharacterized protein YutE (UPF0331/DUF86 family)
MVDKTLILRKLSEIDQYLFQVREYAGISIERYESEWKTQRIVERTLQMIIETCMDIAAHIISDQAFRTPKSYSDTFRVLHENGALPASLFAKMEKMAKFRNVVVHHYDRVDAEIVVGILKKDLNDFLDYRTAIVSYLESESPASQFPEPRT